MIQFQQVANTKTIIETKSKGYKTHMIPNTKQKVKMKTQKHNQDDMKSTTFQTQKQTKNGKNKKDNTHKISKTTAKSKTKHKNKIKRIWNQQDPKHKNKLKT